MAIEFVEVPGDDFQIIQEVDTATEVSSGGENVAVVSSEYTTDLSVDKTYQIQVFQSNEIVQTTQVVEVHNIEHLSSE